MTRNDNKKILLLYVTLHEFDVFLDEEDLNFKIFNYKSKHILDVMVDFLKFRLLLISGNGLK